jgi:hypothetical protein
MNALEFFSTQQIKPSVPKVVKPVNTAYLEKPTKTHVTHAVDPCAVEKACQLPGITIERCGSWYWVSGETKPVKDKLLELGFKYSGNKQRWYLGNGCTWHKHAVDMQTIRQLHGSEIVKDGCHA